MRNFNNIKISSFRLSSQLSVGIKILLATNCKIRMGELRNLGGSMGGKRRARKLFRNRSFPRLRKILRFLSLNVVLRVVRVTMGKIVGNKLKV